MADLDDFFAKKDRKKSKSTKKFATTEEVAKKLEDSAKKTEKLKKERAPGEGEDSAAPIHEQDEWKDFEEEKKDYTGLKIGNLAITTTAEGTPGTKEQTTEQQQEEESAQEIDRKAGPWRRIDSEVQEEIPVKVVEKKPETLPNVTKGTYVPPGMRNMGNQQQAPPSRMKTKTAPDIHNEEFFPTLSKTGGDYKKNRSEGSFEVVQHNRSSSHRQVELSKISSSQGPKLSLGNRYNTLSNDS
nr:protein CDV3 homolog [Leptinotarsa decemlineata]